MARPVPLYRLYSASQGDHFYTTSAEERDNAIAKYGYASEGVACFVWATDDELAQRDAIAVAVLTAFATSGGQSDGKVLRGDVERAYAYADEILAFRS